MIDGCDAYGTIFVCRLRTKNLFIDLKMDQINSRITKPPDKMKSYCDLDFMFYWASQANPKYLAYYYYRVHWVKMPEFK